VFGFILIGSALPRLPAAVGSMLIMLQPVIAVGFGVLLLAEQPTTLQLAGVVLLLTGVLVGSTRRFAWRPTWPRGEGSGRERGCESAGRECR
jgi:drug/metabolite transporter (DMT)-like permease